MAPIRSSPPLPKLPGGAVFEASGQYFSIRHQAGSGNNDVVVTRVKPPTVFSNIKGQPAACGNHAGFCFQIINGFTAVFDRHQADNDIRVKGQATSTVNSAFLTIGPLLANVLGTTGAAMLLIRPWIRMNRYRITGRHIAFFIFIICNVGGTGEEATNQSARH